jgi:hypothetical protein
MKRAVAAETTGDSMLSDQCISGKSAAQAKSAIFGGNRQNAGHVVRQAASAKAACAVKQSKR